MNALSRKTRLKRFIELVWNEGKLDAADGYLAGAYTVVHDPGDPWEGMTLDPAGFKDRVRLSRAAFPDQQFDVQEMLADGGGVAMTWLWAGTHVGDLPGFPATGKPIHMSGATIYFFDDADRLTGHWQITDRLGVYQQLQRNLTASR
ncbi:ester cyclase [Sphingomonas sp. CL5.1]|uniref:ester cyclase n=1 Tax=Sphingomonas sp. CL5.1 TaxID=2653203 RepID=UPI0020C61A6C|nr:ester cyclase [Sphingomonas sp. CL5.1]